MNKQTKKALDNIVQKFQSWICVERDKTSTPNQEKVIDYLIPILFINKEFGTNYSITPKKYDITKLPLED